MVLCINNKTFIKCKFISSVNYVLLNGFFFHEWNVKPFKLRSGIFNVKISGLKFAKICEKLLCNDFYEYFSYFQEMKCYAQEISYVQ